MKFKRIEISAFRIYDNPADATFDFSTRDGQPADFVSLYAPNGFGKTSFYDAVEWGVTNNIQRFWQNEEVAEHSIQALKELTQKAVKLWRHTNSVNDTYVKIETDQEGDPLYRELRLHGNAKVDASKDQLEQKEFRKVILSQEWISAFLKEVNGAQRYRVFMENPELVFIDHYYKNVKILLTICNERIAALESENERMHMEMAGLQAGNLLDAVNSTVSLLKQLGEDLPAISLTMTKEEALAFKNLITDKVVSRDLENRSIGILQHIEWIRLGGKGIESLETYYKVCAEVKGVLDHLDKANANLSLFTRKNELQAQKTNYQRQRSEQQNQIETCNHLLEIFPLYSGMKQEIELKSQQILQLQKELGHTEKDLSNLRRFEINAFTRLNSLIAKINESERLMKELPSKEEKLADLQMRNKDVQTRLASLDVYIERLEEETNQLETVRKEFVRLLSILKDDEFAVLLSQKSMVPKFEVLTTIVENQKLRAEYNLQLEEVDHQIAQTQNLDIALKRFLEEGIKIVNDTQTSTCPLCEHDYNSYSDLAARIAGNKVLSNALQLHFSRRKELADSILSLNQLITTEKQELESFLQENLAEINRELAEQSKRRNTEAELKTSLQGEISTQLKQIDEINKIFGGQAIPLYKETIAKTLGESVQLRDAERTTLETTKTEIAKLIEKKNRVTEETKLLDVELINLQASPKYIEITEWFHKVQAPVKLTTLRRFELTSAGRFKLTTLRRSKLTT